MDFLSVVNTYYLHVYIFLLFLKNNAPITPGCNVNLSLPPISGSQNYVVMNVILLFWELRSFLLSQIILFQHWSLNISLQTAPQKDILSFISSLFQTFKIHIMFIRLLI